jgi:hypothetical protein
VQYDKLIQKTYDKEWMRYRNVGDHMGCMLRPFAKNVVAPLMIEHAKRPDALGQVKGSSAPAARS